MASMPLQYRQHLRLLHSKGHSDAVTAVSFSPSGLLLVSGGLDGRVCIWEISSGKLQYVFCGKSAVLSTVWTSTSDEQVVCGMEDGTIASCAISDVRSLVL